MKKSKKNYIISFTLISVISIVVLLFSLDISNSNTLSSSENTANENIDKNTSLEEKQEVNNDKRLFIGDSFTYLLTNTITEENSTSIVMAKSGVEPSYWVDNFNTLPNNEDVNSVVLLIGVNGVTYDDNLPNKKALIDNLVNKYKNKTIYIQEVFPVGSDFNKANPITFNNAIKEHNEEIKEYIKTYKNVKYIDSTKDLVTEDGYLKYTTDGLHISSDKQSDFYNNILVAIKDAN